MTVRGVRLRLVGDDADVKAKLDATNEKITLLKERAGGIKLGLDDAASKYKLAVFNRDIDKLSKRVVSPRVTLDGAERAELSALRLEATLDRLDAKTVTASSRSRFRLSSLWSRAALQEAVTGSAPEGEAAGLGDFLLSPAGAVAAGAGVGMLPAIAGGLLGFGVGGAGLMLAEHYDKPGMSRALAPISAEFKSIGQSVARDFIPVIRQVAGFVKSLAPELRQLFQASIPGIKQFVIALEPAVRQMLPALTQTLQQLNKSGLMKDLGQAFGYLLTGAVKALSGMARAFEASGALIRGVARVIGEVVTGLGRMIGHAVQFVADLFHGRWRAAWNDFKGISLDITRTVEGIMGSWWGGLGRLFQRGVNDVVNWFGRLPGRLLAAVRALPREMFAIGGQIIQGLINGLDSMTGGLLSKAQSLASSVIGAMKGILGIHSPSRVMHDIGANIGLGLSQGIDLSHSGVAAFASRLGMAVPSAFGGIRPAARFPAARGGRLELAISPAPGMNADLASAIVRMLRFEVRTQGHGSVATLLERH